MLYSLSNSSLYISVESSGAELKSLQTIPDGLEWMWQADPQFWPRTSPVLFPFVGRLVDNQYKYEGKTYPMSQHGFARDREFELLRNSGEGISLILKADQKSKEVYPFDFELVIHYILQENTLRVKYQVHNNGDTNMPFSLGAHPGFRCPLLPNEKFTGYYIEMEQEEKNLQRHLVEGPFISGETETVELDGNKIWLKEELFGAKDAIILKNTRSSFLELASKNHSHKLRFNYSGFPYIAIWSKPGPFVCLEPWLGIADKKGFSGELEDKEGILFLAPKVTFECEWSVSCK